MQVTKLARFSSLALFLSLPLGFALGCGQQNEADKGQADEAVAVSPSATESLTEAAEPSLEISTEEAALTRALPPYTLRQAKGLKAQDIQGAVDGFRADLGGGNNLGAVGTQPQGHREINWDGVPANFSSPNAFPGDFFKARGALFHGHGGRLQVSSKASESIEVAFSNINPAFSKLFRFFSPEKLFSPIDKRTVDVTFTVPGSDVPATVKGFGAVFTDVDQRGLTEMEFYDRQGKRILEIPVPEVSHANGSLSFVGVQFNNGQSIARVRMKLGNVALKAFRSERDGEDAVATDDFLYAEPVKIMNHH